MNRYLRTYLSQLDMNFDYIAENLQKYSNYSYECKDFVSSLTEILDLNIHDIHLNSS